MCSTVLPYSALYENSNLESFARCNKAKFNFIDFFRERFRDAFPRVRTEDDPLALFVFLADDINDCQLFFLTECLCLMNRVCSDTKESYLDLPTSSNS